LFGIRERGFIREGYFADFAIVDLDAPNVVAPEDLYYKCGWSPLEDTTLRSQVTMTVLGGKIVYRDGKLNGPPQGQALQFGEASA
jgi:dihydroorotase